MLLSQQRQERIEDEGEHHQGSRAEVLEGDEIFIEPDIQFMLQHAEEDNNVEVIGQDIPDRVSNKLILCGYSVQSGS